MNKKQEFIVSLDNVMSVFNDNVSKSGNFNDFLNSLVRVYDKASGKYEDDGYSLLACECKHMCEGLYDLLDNVGYYDEAKKVLWVNNMVEVWVYRDNDDKSLVYVTSKDDANNFYSDSDTYVLVRHTEMYGLDVERANAFWNALREVAKASDNMSPNLQEFNAVQLGDFIRWNECGKVLKLAGLTKEGD